MKIEEPTGLKISCLVINKTNIYSQIYLALGYSNHLILYNLIRVKIFRKVN